MENKESDKKECERILHRHGKMQVTRQVTEATWQEIMENCVPRKGDILIQLTPGDKRGNELFDSTAITSLQLLTGALHSMLTNQTTRFFDLVFGDPYLDDDDEVQRWLQIVANKMYAVINGSNFQTEVHELYLDECSIGTACMFIGEHEDRVVHFNARSMKEIYCKENNLGLIDIVHREFKWDIRQIIQEFGEDSISENMRRLYKSGNDDEFCILHAVEPESDSGKYFGFKSIYLLKEEKHILNRKGFKEFPFVVPRWTKTTGETYGRGPGGDVLPDVKMVNKMMEDMIKAANKNLDPSMAVVDDGVIGKVRLTPGGLTVVRAGLEDPIRPLIPGGIRMEFTDRLIESVQAKIRAGFYVDQLQLNNGPQMTATEVNQRTEEKLRLMGPVLGRQHFEFLRPLIERVFGIMVRKGLIPEAPEKISGKRFDVKYSSLIARAQRMNDAGNLTRAIAAASPIINAIPSTLDNINGDRAVRDIFEKHGVEQKVMNDTNEMKTIRDAKAKVQEEAVKQQNESHMADVAGKTMPGVAQLQQAVSE
jgi:hypothetical protein